jgi:hypothetical protein
VASLPSQSVMFVDTALYHSRTKECLWSQRGRKMRPCRWSPHFRGTWKRRGQSFPKVARVAYNTFYSLVRRDVEGRLKILWVASDGSMACRRRRNSQEKRTYVSSIISI